MRQYNAGDLWPDELALVAKLVAEIKSLRSDNGPGDLKDLQIALVLACVASNADA